MNLSKERYAIAAMWTGMALINGTRAGMHNEQMQELQVSYTNYNTGEILVEDTDRSNRQELNRNIALGLVALNLAIAGMYVANGVDSNRKQNNIPTVKNTGKPVM
jgi:hypothetical protein